MAFGDAHSYGSMNTSQLNTAAVGIAATPDGHGYWLAARNGTVLAFGDAQSISGGSTQLLARNRQGAKSSSYYTVGIATSYNLQPQAASLYVSDKHNCSSVHDAIADEHDGISSGWRNDDGAADHHGHSCANDGHYTANHHHQAANHDHDSRHYDDASDDEHDARHYEYDSHATTTTQATTSTTHATTTTTAAPTHDHAAVNHHDSRPLRRQPSNLARRRRRHRSLGVRPALTTRTRPLPQGP